MSDKCPQCGLPLRAAVELTMRGDSISCVGCAKRQLTHMASKAEQWHRKYEELRTKAEANFKQQRSYIADLKVKIRELSDE